MLRIRLTPLLCIEELRSPFQELRTKDSKKIERSSILLIPRIEADQEESERFELRRAQATRR